MESESKATPKVKSRANAEALQTKIRKDPVGALRVLFFVLIWSLALANVIVVVREFRHSLPFVIGLGRRRRIGIEDSRRQALPIIIAPCVTLIIAIPIAIGLPLFRVASFLALYVVEVLWTGLIMIITLAGAASLSPQPTSPLLPKRLQNDLSVALALSFIIVILLTFYHIILLSRVSFLMGKSGINPMHVTVFSLLNRKDTQSTANNADSELKKEEQNITPEEMARVDDRIDKGSIKTLSSGWDEEEEGKGKKAAQNQSAFSKAKNLFTSTK